MTLYTSDSFTDANGTSVSSHAPDVGSAYDVERTDGLIESNSLTTSSFGNALFYANPPPSSADYKVTGTYICDSDNHGLIGLIIRATSGGADNWYLGGWENNTQGWKISSFASFTETVLVTNTSPVVTISTSYDLELEVSGTLLTLTVDGTVVCSITDSTYSATGQGGVDLGSLVQGYWSLDNFTVEDGGGGGGGTHVLTGRGNDSLAYPAWLSISITGRPLTLSNGNAEPTNWYHVGMISWGTANGAMTAYPVTRDLDMVELPAGMDTLWYEFVSGVTATIVELSSP